MGSAGIKAVLYCDGASKGNPGPAGAGFVLRGADGEFVASASLPLGTATNNQAEYRALMAGLAEASARGVTHLQVCSDSELLCHQLNGRYRVRSSNLKQLYASARSLLQQFDSVTVRHVPREHNTEADRLADSAARAAREDAYGRDN